MSINWDSTVHIFSSVFLVPGLVTPRDIEIMMQESLKMRDFNHPNVISLIGVSITVGNPPNIVMPYMANGSLLYYLRKERPNLSVAHGADTRLVGSICLCSMQ